MKRVFCLFLMCICVIALQGQEPVQIIVNSSNTLDSLDTSVLRNIYMGKKTKWDNGDKIIPVLLKGDTVQNTFLETYVLKNKDAYDSYWRQRIFTGKGVPPIALESEKDVLEYVSQNSASISFVSISAVVDSFAVRVISVVK